MIPPIPPNLLLVAAGFFGYILFRKKDNERSNAKNPVRLGGNNRGGKSRARPVKHRRQSVTPAPETPVKEDTKNDVHSVDESRSENRSGGTADDLRNQQSAGTDATSETQRLTPGNPDNKEDDNNA